MSGLSRCVAVLLGAALVLSPVAGMQGSLFAADEAAAARHGSFLWAKPGGLSGKVVFSDGKSPAKFVPVRIWSTTKKKFVHNTITDKEGAYKLPKLASDNYLAVFGDRVCVDLRVDEKATSGTQSLKVVIPRGRVLAAPGTNTAVGVAASSTSAYYYDRDALMKALIIGGIIVGVVGGATAVAAVTRVGPFRSSHHSP